MSTWALCVSLQENWQTLSFRLLSWQKRLLNHVFMPNSSDLLCCFNCTSNDRNNVLMSAQTCYFPRLTAKIQITKKNWLSSVILVFEPYIWENNKKFPCNNVCIMPMYKRWFVGLVQTTNISKKKRSEEDTTIWRHSRDNAGWLSAKTIWRQSWDKER